MLANTHFWVAHMAGGYAIDWLWTVWNNGGKCVILSCRHWVTFIDMLIQMLHCCGPLNNIFYTNPNQIYHNWSIQNWKKCKIYTLRRCHGVYITYAVQIWYMLTKMVLSEQLWLMSEKRMGRTVQLLQLSWMLHKYVIFNVIQIDIGLHKNR